MGKGQSLTSAIKIIGSNLHLISRDCGWGWSPYLVVIICGLVKVCRECYAAVVTAPFEHIVKLQEETDCP